MRILGLIDSLCSGGAQRQMTMLARVLKGRGHDFSLLTYRDHDFFKPEMDEVGVPVYVEGRNKFTRVADLYRAIRRIRPHAVISFMEGPNIYGELASLPTHPFVLIASERRGWPGEVPRKARMIYQFHRFADFVVTNSAHMQGKINGSVPGIAHKTRVILNCVDMDRFKPQPMPANDDCRIVVLGRLSSEKNCLGVYEGFRQVRQMQTRRSISFDWYGNNYVVNGQPTKNSADWLELCSRLKADGTEDVFRLHDPVNDVLPLYAAADGVLLASFFEGCANVICEALACSRPVLASDVCDNGFLVHHQENGFLFDPHNPADMAEKMAAFANLTPEDQAAMGAAGQTLAQQYLQPDVFADQWLDLIHQGLKQRGIACDD